MRIELVVLVVAIIGFIVLVSLSRARWPRWVALIGSGVCFAIALNSLTLGLAYLLVATAFLSALEERDRHG